jgi:protease IV
MPASGCPVGLVLGRGILALLLVGAVASRAMADEVPASLFRGARIPNGAVAGDADGTAIEMNPGQLGALSGASSALVVDAWGREVRRPGRGGALMLGAPLAFGTSLGAGFQWLKPTRPATIHDCQKLQLGLGLRLGRGGGLGFAWEHIFNSGMANTNSLSFGLGLQVAPFLSVGAVVRDVNRPRVDTGTPDLPRVWELEAAVRPLTTDRIEMAAGLRMLQGHDFVALPHVRVSARVARGVVAFAELDWPRYHMPETPAAGGPAVTAASDYAALLGVTVEQERFGATVAGVGNWRDDQKAADFGPGVSVMLRSFPTRHAPLVPGRVVARVKVNDLQSDRNFLTLLVQMRRLADDPSVAALLLDIDEPNLGLGRTEEMRGVILELRRRKPVLAHLIKPGTREYYLASPCDLVFIDPAVGLSFGGLSQTVTFFKNTLDRLGVEVELVRIAEFKGAMEPFVLNHQSAPVATNRNSVLDDNFGRMLAGVVEARSTHGLDQAKLRGLVDRAMLSPTEARDAGLVDMVVDEDELKKFVAETLGPVSDADTRPRDAGRWRPQRIAVVLVDGNMVDGDGTDWPFPSGEVAWSERIIGALEEAGNDPSVVAVVLRINSPGGSALAADRIARAIMRVRKMGKPVLASMGDVAASGGYYVAAPTMQILASPATVTGSIGIYGFKVNAKGLFGHLGIASETYKRGEHADLYSASRAWTDEERALITGQMQHMYQRFLDTVAEGRKITSKRVDELGRGQIWTGSQAAGVGLVDRMGGVIFAIDEAARRAGVSVGPGALPEIVVLPRPSASLLGALSRVPGGREAMQLVLPLIQQGSSGVLARLPYDIETK